MPLILLRYWREALIVAALIAAVGLWRARERALVERGRLAERARVADSALAVLRPQLARLDSTLLARQPGTTRLITRWLTDTAWRHDTVRVAGDSQPRIAIPIGTLVAADSAAEACQSLLLDCDRFRVTAGQTIRALEARIAAAPPPRSCTVPVLVGTVIGVAGGYAGSRIR